MNFKNALVAANLGAIALAASLSAQAATPSTHTIQLIAGRLQELSATRLLN